MRQIKYFRSKKEALKSCEERNKTFGSGKEISGEYMPEINEEDDDE